ncbi:MAG: eL32 family ribosomal protein [Candidatus Pacearchaeota archaeon]
MRKDSYRMSKLGKKRKKKIKWRKPRGKHNKLREKRKGYLRQPSIGWGSPKKIKGSLMGVKIKAISNLKDVENLQEGEKVMLLHIGKKKKQEILKKALEKNIEIINAPKKFLEDIEKKR